MIAGLEDFSLEDMIEHCHKLAQGYKSVPETLTIAMIKKVITPKIAKDIISLWDTDGCSLCCRSSGHFAVEISKKYPRLADIPREDNVDFAECLYHATQEMVA